MMKMVVAYIDRDKFDPIRAELLELGFVSLSVSDVSGSMPLPTVSGRYRGASFEQHLRPKARVECVVGAEHTQTVVDTVLDQAGERVLVVVMTVDEAHPTHTIKGAEEAALQDA
jgi:nitrogen regulatory protein PII